MKYKVCTAKPEGFIEGWSTTFITIAADLEPSEGRVVLGEVDFDPSAVDITEVRQAAVKSIDAEMEKQRTNFTAGMERLQNRKESLLAIEHKPEESE